MNWFELYGKEIAQKGGSVQFVRKKRKEKKVLLEIIKAHAFRGARILEAGCGTGANATYLAAQGYSVEAIDVDDAMLSLARSIAREFPNRPMFRNMDISCTTYNDEAFDVVFSHGVLEHFSDEDITRTLQEQMRIGKTVVFSVPTDYFSEDQKMYGDERFMSVSAWRDILKQTGGTVMDTFGYHYEGLMRIITAAFPRLFVGHTPYLGFVLRKTP